MLCFMQVLFFLFFLLFCLQAELTTYVPGKGSIHIVFACTTVRINRFFTLLQLFTTFRCQSTVYAMVVVYSKSLLDTRYNCNYGVSLA